MKKMLIQGLVGLSLIAVGFGSAWIIQNERVNEVKLTSNRQSSVVRKEANEVITMLTNKLEEQAKNNLVGFKGEVTEVDPNFYKEDGSRLFELTDGSWFIINEEKGEYIFQPIDLGDWCYKLDNMTQLENIIKTYVNIKNTGTW